MDGDDVVRAWTAPTPADLPHENGQLSGPNPHKRRRLMPPRRAPVADPMHRTVCLWVTATGALCADVLAARRSAARFGGLRETFETTHGEHAAVVQVGGAPQARLLSSDAPDEHTALLFLSAAYVQAVAAGTVPMRVAPVVALVHRASLRVTLVGYVHGERCDAFHARAAAACGTAGVVLHRPSGHAVRVVAASASRAAARAEPDEVVVRENAAVVQPFGVLYYVPIVRHARICSSSSE